MSNPKTGFILYFDSAPILAQLSPEQRGWLLSALFQYADRAWREPGVTQEDVLLFYPQLTPQSRTAFGFLASTSARDAPCRWWSRSTNSRQMCPSRAASTPVSFPSRKLPQNASPARVSRSSRKRRNSSTPSGG